MAQKQFRNLPLQFLAVADGTNAESQICAN